MCERYPTIARRSSFEAVLTPLLFNDRLHRVSSQSLKHSLPKVMPS
ncbi:MAG: hypothetical protein H7Z11_00660 [Verrucomicrobia bacterium]|nr:hypothetical protein [Leptolyngbya sp. ES-bin-22]